ncbi:hypothetical protein KEM55_005145, partial [Ascosphaera atra]
MRRRLSNPQHQNGRQPRERRGPDEHGRRRAKGADDADAGAGEVAGRAAQDQDLRRAAFVYEHTGGGGAYIIPRERTKQVGTNTFQLALKHRQERSQRQRIIVFTCSAITEDEKALIKLAKRMKKYSVSIDIVGFGDLDDETLKKLEAFHANVDAGNTSHLAIVPAGPNLLSDQLVGTPIV